MSADNVLVINCGSSSLKFAVIDSGSGERWVTGLAERLSTAVAEIHWQTHTGAKQSEALPDGDHQAALQRVHELLESLGLLPTIRAVGHRVVHGGEQFTHSTLIDGQVLVAIEACVPLAPLHNPANLVGIRGAQVLFPGVPHTAVFDTAFHQTMPPHAYLYPVPYAWYSDYHVRRYGFHGTSHRYVTQQAAVLLGRPYETLALISAHLGNGCSAAAVLNGQSIDTSMGLTPLEGLVMGTRSGDVDPSLHEFMAAQMGLSLAEVTAVLNKQSGLLGISGISNDMRTLLSAAEQGNQQAQLAIDVFCYRLAKQIGSYAVALGRLDALIFTGGIGERSAAIRAQVIRQLGILGLVLDEAQNSQGYGQITTTLSPNSPVALVIPTDEELVIAQDSIALLAG
jgi:acetate kinase